MKWLDVLHNQIDGLTKGIIILTMIMIPTIMFLQVILRYFFNHPLAWAEEFTRIIFVWLVFMTACAALRRGEIVALDLFLTRMNPLVAFWFTVFARLLTLAFLIVAGYSGAEMTAFVFQRGTPTPALEVPVWISYIALPIGCAFMSFQVVMDLIHSFVTRRSYSMLDSPTYNARAERKVTS